MEIAGDDVGFAVAEAVAGGAFEPGGQLRMTYRAAPSHLHRDRVPWTAHGSALSAFQTHQLYQPEAAEVAGDDVGFVVAGAIADDLPRRAEPFFQTHQLYLSEAVEIAGDDVRLAVAEAVTGGAFEPGTGRLRMVHRLAPSHFSRHTSRICPRPWKSQGTMSASR